MSLRWTYTWVDRRSEYEELSNLTMQRKPSKIWLKLLQESWAYQLVLFHRSNPKWYVLQNQEIARKKLSEASNNLRKGNMEILVKRFYIEKANGKLRPIGAPNLTSKMIGKAIADMMLWCGGSDIPYQHGFTPNKGIHTAIVNIVDNYESGLTNTYEFDLKGWFNHVRVIWVKDTISTWSSSLSVLFGQLIFNTHIKFEELKQETELVKETSRGDKPVISRRGMTQGMPYSPIAANIALGKEAPKGITMYADDGVYQSRDLILPDWLYKIEIVGAIIEPIKSAWRTGEFEFLGIQINLNEGKLRHQSNSFTWTEWNSQVKEQLLKWLKGINSKYQTVVPLGWHWDITVNSYITCLTEQLTNSQYIQIMWNSLWHAKPWKGWRFFLGGHVVDTLSASSRCLELITKDRSLMYKAKVRPINLDKKMGMQIDRGKYWEVIPYEYHPTGHRNVIQGKLLSIKPRVQPSLRTPRRGGWPPGWEIPLLLLLSPPLPPLEIQGRLIFLGRR